jgi:hypothetical protein
MVEMVIMGLRVVMMRRMNKFLMLRRSTPLPTYTWELQFSDYPSTLIGGRKLATRGKTYLMREKRKENLRLVEKEPGSDYRFHTTFQQDFYEPVIIAKTNLMVISQWIDWTYMEEKHDTVFDEVVGSCRAKHLRDVMAFKKN